MATLVRLYKEALQQLARVLAATAEEADAATEHISAMLIKIRDHHVDESPGTWKKLVLDMKVRSRYLCGGPHTGCQQLLAPLRAD
jgi:hypothetical protein